jgi:hypothetical protein
VSPFAAWLSRIREAQPAIRYGFRLNKDDRRQSSPELKSLNDAHATASSGAKRPSGIVPAFD